MNIFKVKGICVFIFFILGALIAVATNLNVLPILLGVLILSILLIFALVNDKFLVASTVYVFILDAGNGLFVYNGHHLLIRELLFSILLIKLAYNIFIKGFKDNDKKAVMAVSILVPFYGVIIALLRQNNQSYIFEDSKSYFFFIIGLCMYSLIYYAPNLKEAIIKHFMIASLIVAMASIIIFVAPNILPVNLYEMSTWLNVHNLGFSGIEINGVPRVFLRAEIYVMASFFFSLGKMASNTKKTFYNSILLKLIYLISLVISNTRGIWIATILGILIFWVFSNFTYKKIIVAFLVVISLIFIPIIFPEFSTKSTERLISSVDFTSNQSNVIRSRQSTYLLDEFYNHPVLGKGFGATLSSGFTRSKESPYSFELSYFELLYKLGIIGFFFFITGMILFVRTICKSSFKQKRVILITFASMLFISATNPYIISSLGMFLLSVLYAIAKTPRSIKT